MLHYIYCDHVYPQVKISGRRHVASHPLLSSSSSWAAWSWEWPCWQSSRWMGKTRQWTQCCFPWRVLLVWRCCLIVAPGGRWQTQCWTPRGRGCTVPLTRCTSWRVRALWRFVDRLLSNTQVILYTVSQMINLFFTGLEEWSGAHG